MCTVAPVTACYMCLLDSLCCSPDQRELGKEDKNAKPAAAAHVELQLAVMAGRQAARDQHTVGIPEGTQDAAEDRQSW